MEKLCILLITITISAVITADEVNRTAVVYLKKDDVEGNITFHQVGSGPVHITGTITGLTDGEHGFHIHQTGDVSNCANAGGHYNPFKKNHGGPTSSERHIGDLGNINSSQKIATINISDNIISLIGDHSIVGRALVVHANRDDLGTTDHPDSKTTGNAGGRVACGVIGIKSLDDTWPRGTSSSSTISALSLGVVSVIAAILSTF